MLKVKQNALRRYFSTIKSDPKYYDIICSGAGIVGSSFAQAMSNFKYFKEQDKNKILLLDLKEPKPIENYLIKSIGSIESTIPEQRTVTLSPASLDFMKELGVMELIEKRRMSPYYFMQVWETEGNSYIQFKEEDGGFMGYTIETSHQNSAVYAKINQSNATNESEGNRGIDLKINDNITNIERVEDRGLQKVTFKSGEECYTKLLVGSDGSRSGVKKLMDIKTWGWSHKQRAIVATVKSTVPTNTLWQRYCERGPVALLSQWDNYYSVIWTVDESTYDYLMSWEDERFIEELNDELFNTSNFKIPLLEFDEKNIFNQPPLIKELCNKRLSFPLNTSNAERYAMDNVAQIGDAAHSIHPMAGQGLNLGLMDANLLANLQCKSQEDGSNFCLYNEGGVQKEYEMKSKGYNYGMQTGIELLSGIYGTQIGPLKYMRNFGLNLINASSMKSLFKNVADGAMGSSEFRWKN